MTSLVGTVLLACVVTVPPTRLAPVMAVVAAVCVSPNTFGTETVVGFGVPPELPPPQLRAPSIKSNRAATPHA